MYKIILFLFITFLPNVISAQLLSGTNENLSTIEHLKRMQETEYAMRNMAKGTKTTSSHILDTTRWRHLIDSTWGAGIDDTAKLTMFNRIWTTIDSMYPCFVNLPLYNWDSIINGMRTEISNGVSRGRFAGILGRLKRYLNDGHTNMYDLQVVYPSKLYLGLPVFRSESGRFGACVTMLPDSSAMVYDAVPGHPFGLQPGDVILGYNNIPWRDLVQLLLHYEMPTSAAIGSTDAATYHNYVCAAGENWYLFDTINIRKCNGTLVSFPTLNMTAVQGYTSLCSEQMQVAGVDRITFDEYVNQDKSLKYGMLAGTKIGYIYMLDCSDMSGDSLYNAVKSLLQDSMAIGLIIDIRTNYGGSFRAFQKAFKYLANGNVQWVGYGERVTPGDRFQMFNQPSAWYDIVDDDPSASNKPVALLCGPGAASAGDFFQVLYKHHPFVRTFGKSTAGAYGALYQIYTGQPGYYANTQTANFYEVKAPATYLTHTEYPIDQPVWFNKDSVCAGRDNIVVEAVKWIYGKLDVEEVKAGTKEITLAPNPARTYLEASISSATVEEARIQIFSIYGTMLWEHTAILKQGNNKIQIDFAVADLPAGNYLLSIEAPSFGRMIEKFSCIK